MGHCSFCGKPCDIHRREDVGEKVWDIHVGELRDAGYVVYVDRVDKYVVLEPAAVYERPGRWD